MGYIYLVINNINNMKYIGQSKCLDINDRWNSHKKMRENSIGSYLLSAYKKYGVNNFTFKLICICFDEDCDNLENYYISKFKTIVPNGYNLKEGGITTKHHPNTIQLMSLKAKEFWTTDRKKQQSLKYSGANHPNFGKKLSDEQRNILSNKSKKYWESLTIEERKNILDKRKCGPLNVNTLNNLVLGRGINAKKVGQYDLENNLLNIYSSTMEASKKTSICLSSIGKVCRGIKKYNTAGCYIWKYI
jgi:group I intron endonuclease